MSTWLKSRQRSALVFGRSCLVEVRVSLGRWLRAGTLGIFCRQRRAAVESACLPPPFPAAVLPLRRTYCECLGSRCSGPQPAHTCARCCDSCRCGAGGRFCSADCVFQDLCHSCDSGCEFPFSRVYVDGGRFRIIIWPACRSRSIHVRVRTERFAAKEFGPLVWHFSLFPVLLSVLTACSCLCGCPLLLLCLGGWDLLLWAGVIVPVDLRPKFARGPWQTRTRPVTPHIQHHSPFRRKIGSSFHSGYILLILVWVRFLHRPEQAAAGVSRQRRENSDKT